MKIIFLKNFQSAWEISILKAILMSKIFVLHIPKNTHSRLTTMATKPLICACPKVNFGNTAY